MANVPMDCRRAEGIDRIAVIGNSLVGALRRACITNREALGGRRFFFFASPGAAFDAIEIRDGRLVNVEFPDESDMRLEAFDAVVIYADFPIPEEVLRIARRVDVAKYSRGLRRSWVRQWLARFTSFRLCTAAATASNGKILVLSRNMMTDECIRSWDERNEGIVVLREVLAPAVYVPLPEDLFDDDGKPATRFYKGSLNILGVEPDRKKLPDHQRYHLNELGGYVVLKAILNALSTPPSG